MEILWLGLAYVLGMVVKQLKLPPLIGYLIAGVVLSAFGVSDENGMLHTIGHYGVIFLLFTVGLHLRIKNIIRPEVFGAGTIHLVISAGIFLMIAMAFGFSAIEGLIIGILLGFSSTVLAAKTLEARGELNAFHARVSIGILIVQDLVAITVLALTGGGIPSVWSFGLLLLPLLRPLLFKLLTSSGHEDLQLLYGLLLAMGGAALFEVLGLSSELGALVAGALLSGTHESDELSEKLWGLKEAFLVGFFLEVGLAGLPNMNDLLFAGALFAVLPIKAVLFFFLVILFKLRSRNSFMVTLTLTSFSEFTLIAGMVAASSGFIPESTIIVFALLIAVSYTVNAPLSAKSNSLWKRFEHKLIPLERNVKHPGQQVVSLGGAEYLVVGMGQAGSSAKEEGISQEELESIDGSGQGGRVSKKDILGYVEDKKNGKVSAPSTTSAKSAAPSKPSDGSISAGQLDIKSPSGEVEIIKMDRMRKMIAEHMVKSVQTSAHVTTFAEVDVTNMVKWRNANKNAFQKKTGHKLTFTPLFVEAIIKAMLEFPLINSSVNGDEIHVKKDINFGLAVALGEGGEGGLIVPVMKKAQQKNLVGLAEAVNEVATKARSKKLSPDDLVGGTITLTNYGSVGNIMGTPIINQPQVAIIGTGAIEKKPVVLETENGDVIAIRQMMYLSMSYDHRIIDGAHGGAFLNRIKQILQGFDMDRAV